MELFLHIVCANLNFHFTPLPVSVFHETQNILHAQFMCMFTISFHTTMNKLALVVH